VGTDKRRQPKLFKAEGYRKLVDTHYKEFQSLGIEKQELIDVVEAATNVGTVVNYQQRARRLLSLRGTERDGKESQIYCIPPYAIRSWYMLMMRYSTQD
jgi:hypothetical protein